METSLSLTPLLKTSVDARVEGLVSNVDYMENRCRNFIQKKYGRKRRLPRTVIFLFARTFYTFYILTFS